MSLRDPSAFVAALVALAAVVMSPAHYLPPNDAPYVAEEFRVSTVGGNSLGGTITLPARGTLRGGYIRRYAAVLLVQAGNHQDRDGSAPDVPGAPAVSRARPLYELADTLTRRDLAVLRLDSRGIDASTGSADSTSVLDRAEDVRVALEALRKRPDVDPRRVALLAMGEGGPIAEFVAANDSLPHALVLMGAPADSTTGRRLLAPALVLQGEADEAIPQSAATTIAAALRARGASDVTVHTFPGLSHAFLHAAAFAGSTGAPASAYVLPAEVRGLTASWLARVLGPPVEIKRPPRVVVHRVRHGTRRRRRS